MITLNNEPEQYPALKPLLEYHLSQPHPTHLMKIFCSFVKQLQRYTNNINRSM
jgi:hypothetical protein